MSWELILSITAILVSAIVGGFSIYFHKRIVKLEEGRESDRIDKSKQADIVARITDGVSRTGKMKYLLSVSNNGDSEARNVKVKIEGETPTNFPDVLTDLDVIEVIAPGNQFDFIVAKSGDTKPYWSVEVLWDDNFEQGRSTRTTLKV